MKLSVEAGKIVEFDSKPTLSDGSAGGIEEKVRDINFWYPIVPIRQAQVVPNTSHILNRQGPKMYTVYKNVHSLCTSLSLAKIGEKCHLVLVG